MGTLTLVGKAVYGINMADATDRLVFADILEDAGRDVEAGFLRAGLTMWVFDGNGDWTVAPVALKVSLRDASCLNPVDLFADQLPQPVAEEEGILFERGGKILFRKADGSEVGPDCGMVLCNPYSLNGVDYVFEEARRQGWQVKE